MSKTVTPTYRLDFTEVNAAGQLERHQIGWNSKHNGRATKENCIRYLRAYQASTQAGGVNEQIGPRTVRMFTLINQKTGNPVVSGSMTQTV